MACTTITILDLANDLMIAVSALAADLTLVIRNQDEFSRGAGLRLTSW